MTQVEKIESRIKYLEKLQYNGNIEEWEEAELYDLKEQLENREELEG